MLFGQGVNPSMWCDRVCFFVAPRIVQSLSIRLSSFNFLRTNTSSEPLRQQILQHYLSLPWLSSQFLSLAAVLEGSAPLLSKAFRNATCTSSPLPGTRLKCHI